MYTNLQAHLKQHNPPTHPWCPQKACVHGQIYLKQKRPLPAFECKVIATDRVEEKQETRQAKRSSAASLPADNGASWAIGLIYFVQGVTEMTTLGTTYFLKDELHSSPATVAMLVTIINVPWMFKPLFGFISDSVPIWGTRRRSHLFLSSVAGALCWFLISLCPQVSLGNGVMGSGLQTLMPTLIAVALLFTGSVGSAVADTVADSMCVEKARDEAQDAAGTLQSLCFAAYSAGAIVSAYFGGDLIAGQGSRSVFAIASAFPLLAVAASLLVPEGATNKAHASATATTTQKLQAKLPNLIHSPGPANQVVSAASPMPLAHAPKTAHVHTEACPSPWRMPGGQALPAQNPKPKAGPGLPAAMQAHAQLLWSVMQRREVLAPLTYLMALCATPSADTALFFYQTDMLHFTPEFLGNIQMAAAVATFGSTLLYTTMLKSVPIRRLMLWSTLLCATMQSSQLLLVSGALHPYGVPDQALALGSAVGICIIQNVLALPVMVVAARLCPMGVEGAMFGAILSLLNLSDGVRQGFGACLTHGLGVVGPDYPNLDVLLITCNGAMLLPLLLLPWVPDGEPSSGKASGQNEGSAVALDTAEHRIQRQ